jgi:hypothetical protein
MPFPFVGWFIAILLVIAGPEGSAQRIYDETGRFFGYARSSSDDIPQHTSSCRIIQDV